MATKRPIRTCGLPAIKPLRRHHQHAVVIGCAHFAFAVQADQRAGLCDDFQPGEWAREAESLCCDGDRMGDLHRFLRERRLGKTERTTLGVDDAEARQEAQRGFARDIDGLFGPVLAAFNQ